MTKQGLVFVFDRVTGEPVWPIEERPVPPSDAPGEAAWPTQPIPSRPPPIVPMGVTPDDVFDLMPTPAAAARARMSELVTGPAYTPPSVKGTIIRPGITGGAHWGGGAIDPRTGTLFVKTSFTPNILRLVRPSELARMPPASDIDAEWIGESSSASFAGSLPLTKAAVRASHRDRSQSGHDQVAGAV